MGELTKVCIKCDIEYENIPENFYFKNSTGKHINVCKECVKSDSRRRREDPEVRRRAIEASRRYYARNREKELEKKREEYDPEVKRRYNQEYYKKNRIRTVLRWHEAFSSEKGVPYDYSENHWEDLVERFEGKCAYCGVGEESLTLDHVIPYSKGGGTVVGNIVPSCMSCNSSKRTKSLDEWYTTSDIFSEGRYQKVLEEVSLE